AWLAARGVVKGDRVALVMPNCPQVIIAQLGVWKAGAVAVPLNPLSSEEELAHALAGTGARAAVVLSRFYPKIKQLQPGTALEVVIATNIKEFLPRLLRLAYTLLKERKEGDRVALAPGDVWFQAVTRARPAAPPRAGPTPSDAALLMLTGGTTGVPKAALLRHRGVLMAALQLNRWFRPVLKEWDDGIAFVFPPFHVAGNVGILGTALVGRNPAVLIPNPRDLNDLLRTIQKARPAVLPAVPTLYNAMLAHPAVRAGKVDFSSVKLCVSGSAPLLAETKRRFEQLTGGRIIEVYSLTEACMASVGTPVMGTYKEGAVGIPLPDVDVRIVDVDDPSQEVGPGEIGEIVIEAPQLMEGYWHNPEATREMLRNGRLYTGDLGSLDGDGYLTIADRKKDLIKASGFQVWPREVEEVIATHPAVAEVGVAGVPDPHSGEAVMAWVVARKGVTPTEEEIREHCRRHLAAYKVPKRVEFREALPKSAIGKLLRRELAREFRAAHNAL
ncbi:MAG TPA: AMP-binding protein, partial [Gemmatimonadales bacterium]|nr:AMP-binding protein [Gemmatimonadales bacterium]